MKDNKCLRLYIRDKTELRKKLLEFLPDDVYYSTSCFMNPKKAKNIKDPYISCRNLLYSDVAFDFDAHDCSIYSAADEARRAMKVIDRYFKRSSNLLVIC